MARTNPYREPCLPEVEAEDGSIDAFATHVAAQRRRAVLSTGVVIACIALAGAVAIGAVIGVNQDKQLKVVLD